jgi:hypothetical protein
MFGLTASDATDTTFGQDGVVAVAADLRVTMDFGVIDLHVDYGWRD